MKLLPVGGHDKGRKGVVRWAKVSNEDYARLSAFKWCFRYRSDGHGGYVYRYVRSARTKSGWGKRRLHHDVMRTKRGIEIDHINGDGLDNRKENLRVATRAENSRNQRIHGRTSRKTSIYKGVGKGSLNRWRARIRFDNHLISLGHFENEDEAAMAYNAAALRLFGAYANLNIIEVMK